MFIQGKNVCTRKIHLKNRAKLKNHDPLEEKISPSLIIAKKIVHILARKKLHPQKNCPHPPPLKNLMVHP